MANVMNAVKNRQVSALDISQYLLSLDPERKYFTSKRMSSEEG